MDYQDFREQFTQDVKVKLVANDMENLELSVQPVEKMNESYEAMTVTPEGSNIGVNLNLERFYEAYESGTDYDEVVDRAVDAIENGVNQIPDINVELLQDYDQMKDKLVMEVVSAETNAELLDKVPHHELEDMVIVYRFVLDNDEDGRATILVTNNLLDNYGVTAEQLHADAMLNAPKIKPAVIQGMKEVISEMMGDDFAMLGVEVSPADEVMFVASVPDKIQGASVIAYQDFMDQAAQKLGGDFFILPSSIHEVLLVKDDGNSNARDLKNMVEEVNATQVSPEEKLTDNVYHYDSKEHIFELAESFEARQMEKDIFTSDKLEGKDSVLKDIKDKQKDIQSKASGMDIPEKTVKVKGGEAI